MVTAVREVEPAAISGPGGVALTVDRVSHAFTFNDQPLPVLDEIDLRVRPGEFVAMLGPSGCGKSTLLRLVTGLETPDAGTITVNSAVVTGPDPSRILMFQDTTLFPWRTVWQYAELGLLKQERGKVDEVLDLVGLSSFAKAYPRQLSGGMAQRVALARALVNEPSLLLLDEPLAKLDSLTRITMQAELIRLWQESGFTSLLVTHDVEEALFMAERVIVLSERPARIKVEIEVDRPYPRHRGDLHLAALRHRVLEELGLAETW